MAEQFSPKDPYEVQAAWETVMTAVEEIRAEKNALMITLQKRLRELLKVLKKSLVAKINKKAAYSRAALSLIRRSAVNQHYYGFM